VVGHAEVEHRDGAAVVRLRGEHDIATSDSLSGLLGRLVQGGTPVVVSIVDVDFLDCASLRVLSEADRVAQALHGRRLVLHYGTTQAVRRLFEATAFLRQIQHSRDVAEAIALARQSVDDCDGPPPGSVRSRS
jgi:anti-anti-sigma factor